MNNIEINNLEDEINNLEKNITKLDIIIILINNFCVTENYIEKYNIENNILNKNLFNKILNNYINKHKDHKLNYLLKFTCNLDLETLNNYNYINNNNKDIYTLLPLKNSNDLYYNDSEFNKINSLILIFSKNDKKFIIKKKEKTRLNRTKKLIKNK